MSLSRSSLERIHYTSFRDISIEVPHAFSHLDLDLGLRD